MSEVWTNRPCCLCNSAINFVYFKEMESLKTKNQVLKTEKEKEIAKHEDELAEVVDKHSKDMQDLGKER